MTETAVAGPGGGETVSESTPLLEERPMNAPDHTVKELPPCEDQQNNRTQNACEPNTERYVLNAHRAFRRNVKGLVAAMALIPLSVFPATWGVALGLNSLGFSDGQSSGLALCFAVLVAAAAVSLFWISGVHLVERRFTNIRRHSLVAAEGVGVDDKEHALDSIETLMRTWAYHQFLLRWLQDVRFAVVVYCTLFLAACATIIASGPPMPIMQSSVTGVYLALVFANMAVPSSFAFRLVREAKRHPSVQPTTSISARMDRIISEVKELRRGTRVRAT